MQAAMALPSETGVLNIESIWWLWVIVILNLMHCMNNINVSIVVVAIAKDSSEHIVARPMSLEGVVSVGLDHRRA